MEEKYHPVLQAGVPAYWYFFCLVPRKGRLQWVGLGPFASEEAATKAAEECGVEDAEFRNYDTKNQHKATATFKAELAKREGIGSAIERMGHEKTLARVQEKER